MAGDGIVWFSKDGKCVAIAGEPAPGIMSQIREGHPFKV
jgi:hypothetical protein